MARSNQFAYCCGLAEISVSSLHYSVSTESEIEIAEEIFYQLTDGNYAGGILTDNNKSDRICRKLTKILGEPIIMGKNPNTGNTLYLWTAKKTELNKYIKEYESKDSKVIKPAAKKAGSKKSSC